VALAIVVCSAWSRTARELVRARRRQQRLHAARRAQVASFGAAVVRGDRELAASLKRATRALEREMQAREDDVTAAVAVARQRIARERDRVPTALHGNLAAHGSRSIWSAFTR
jgi:hypothetical protein